MSMYSNYSLDVAEYAESERTALEAEIDKLNVFTEGNIQDGYSAYDTWYDWRQDMRLLSARFPNVLFTLGIVGADYDGEDRVYFKGGQYQDDNVEVIYHPFDPDKLTGEPLDTKNLHYQYE